MQSWKGHPALITALSQIKDVPNWTCWIAGGPQQASEESYLAELQSHVEREKLSNRVNFLGQRTDVPRLMAACDIFCQANAQAEPFGIVFIEALYAGKPVVTFALGGPLEILNDSCGVLVPPGDISALAFELKKLIESKSLRGALSAGGVKRAREMCDPAKTLRELANFLGAR
jgi:glycosyltransferase involved in cell wall biosynthesis